MLIRCRKTPDQIKILRKELRVSGEWEKKDVVRMAEMTGLSMSQVYKWFWDQRKRKIEGPRRRKVWAEEVGQ